MHVDAFNTLLCVGQGIFMVPAKWYNRVMNDISCWFDLQTSNLHSITNKTIAKMIILDDLILFHRNATFP